MSILKLIFYFAITCILNSCAKFVTHSPFVASSFEPLLVNKKGAKQVSLGLFPIKYGYADITYAATDHIALRVNALGTYGLGNFSGSVMYYKSLNKLSYFAGGLFNYQSNQLHRELGVISGTFWKNWDYSCLYYSPGLVMGLSLKGRENSSHHLILKPQYNFVQSYNYSYQVFDRYDYFVNEQLNYKIPDFLSIEISYSYVVPINYGKGNFKFQIGGHFTQKTLQHHYIYNARAPYTGGEMYLESTNFHPVSFPVNISLGFIFFSRKD